MIVAQRELPGGRQQIVAVDPATGGAGVLAEPTPEWTYQAPKMMPDGHLMAYRLRHGEQFNLHSDRNELVIFDGPGLAPRVIPRPAIAPAWGRNGIAWSQHGHATPTAQGTLIHAVKETETWWLLPWPIRSQWVLVETDILGVPTGRRWVDQAEPSWTPRGLTCISTAGTGAVITPARIFDKAAAPIGSKSFGWFDPHLSPDGQHVVWLDLVAVGIGVTSGLIVADVTTGAMRYLVRPTSEMQTDAMWLDASTLVGARWISGEWRIVLIGLDGKITVVPGTSGCTAVHVS